MRSIPVILGLAAVAAAASACTSPGGIRQEILSRPVDVGLRKGYSAQLVAANLNNPSCVLFSPKGELTICDSGNGRIVIVKDGKIRNHITGFATEYKSDDKETLVRRFQVGPMSAVWLGPRKLAVTDAGRGDGEETIRFYRGAGYAEDGETTNPVTSTTDDLADQGEGTLTGLVRGPGGRSLYLCGQGTDLRTWILRCDVTDKKLWTFASADVEGLKINTPMQCVLSKEGTLLVLYSGTATRKDGAIVEWSLDTGEKGRTWDLPGLVDPMSMTFVPNTDELALVEADNAATHVRPGRLARVKLPKEGGKAEVTVVATSLRGPTSCAFGPDGRLYVSELGRQFDLKQGRVIAISGF